MSIFDCYEVIINYYVLHSFCYLDRSRGWALLFLGPPVHSSVVAIRGLRGGGPCKCEV